MVVRDLIVTDNTGREVNTAASTAGPSRDDSQRPFFTAHEDETFSSLYISPPARNPRTGSWSIMLSRPLLRGETKVGVVAAEVQTSVFANFFKSVVTTSETQVALMFDDGTLVASDPHHEELIGHKLPRVDQILPFTNSQPSGVNHHVIGVEGKEQLVSFRRIPSRSMVITVSRDRDAILARWWRRPHRLDRRVHPFRDHRDDPTPDRWSCAASTASSRSPPGSASARSRQSGRATCCR